MRAESDHPIRAVTEIEAEIGGYVSSPRRGRGSRVMHTQAVQALAGAPPK